MTTPVELTAEDITGQALYEGFWKRNGTGCPPWEGQSAAIISMWNDIAENARNLTGLGVDGAQAIAAEYLAAKAGFNVPNGHRWDSDEQAEAARVRWVSAQEALERLASLTVHVSGEGWDKSDWIRVKDGVPVGTWNDRFQMDAGDNSSAAARQHAPEHTPGPWVYQYTRMGHTVRQSPDAARALMVVNTSENPEADARLIAASPELFERGNTLVARLAEFENDLLDDEVARQFHGHVMPALARLRAAIAQVTNTQHFTEAR